MNDGGTAFPSHGSMGEVAWEGMTLRDYFAAKAMEGMLSKNYNEVFRAPKNYAIWAYEYADEMLKEREKTKP